MSTKVTVMLSNYPLYKCAIQDYEKPFADDELADHYTTAKYEYAAPARVVLYSDMPMGTGSGSRAPTLTGGWSLQDIMEYNDFKYAVERIECAMLLLTDMERDIVTLKWMKHLTLAQIGERKRYSRGWVKEKHTKALHKLSVSLRFDNVPVIVKIESKV